MLKEKHEKVKHYITNNKKYTMKVPPWTVSNELLQGVGVGAVTC